MENRPYFTGELLSLIAYGISKSADKMPEIFWSESKDYFLYKGDRFSIPIFKRMVQELIQDAEDLQEGLLFTEHWSSQGRDPFQGTPLPQILTLLHDNHGEHMASYSFITDSRNKELLVGLESFLLETLISTPVLCQKYLQLIPGTTPQWKLDPTSRYLGQAEALLGKILLIVHITSGQPGRGPEITDLDLWNTASHRRNIYIADGRMMITTWYELLTTCPTFG